MRDGVGFARRETSSAANTVKFSWPAPEGELAPQDLFAMEVMRLFDGGEAVAERLKQASSNTIDRKPWISWRWHDGHHLRRTRSDLRDGNSRVGPAPGDRCQRDLPAVRLAKLADDGKP